MSIEEKLLEMWKRCNGKKHGFTLHDFILFHYEWEDARRKLRKAAGRE